MLGYAVTDLNRRGHRGMVVSSPTERAADARAGGNWRASEVEQCEV